MPSWRHLAAGLGTVTLCALGTAVPAQAAGPGYVALGDSYSSGTGTRTYLADGSSCQRSVYAYPSLVAASKGYDLNFRACSGAKVADVTSLQLSALSSSTAYVTISVGGNDAGFADVMTTCAQPAWASDCNGAIAGAQSIITGPLPGRLSTLYAAIRSKAPQATVVVAGYPRIFNGEDCNALTWFSPDEETRLNAMADLLNARIATAASAAGFRFVNPTTAFTGHAVCDDVEWVNGLSSPVSESYHPNRSGQSSGYTPLVGGRLTGTTVTATASVLATAEASATELTAQQRGHAARDRAVRPAEFRAPDLTSPATKAAAARAGVDLSDRASIDAADARYAAEQAHAG
ncbi:SGNH/GDSL hydrolase family protein [Blastococcus sp. TF02-8]|uniref:SGNH/GDSL hydrolase family protein n=1 Tax=Blastococcus sp. TF02-8 TaxID=2250574 RepID=UPI000DEBFF68|nr:SGNH/GDSL hydrolase family protein [Blastococcus sp. TF02-8]RBY96596.1 SGNH/GDSL hydrolase family protein [Blastococcus sp. TF02-8]